MKYFEKQTPPQSFSNWKDENTEQLENLYQQCENKVH